MAEAARLLEGEGARIIDINLGCPAKKVTNGWSGSALMREPDHALRLIDAVARAVTVPVTVKMRLGWNSETLNAPEIAARAEAAGVAMFTVHGRTRCQFYTGSADWDAIGAVVRAVGVPVIANGDVTGRTIAREALRRSGAAGLMIGRGARGRPWMLGGIAAELSGDASPRIPRSADLAELMIGHYEAMLTFYGHGLGPRVARKHLSWYLDRIAGAEALRARVLRLAEPAEVIRTIRRELPDLDGVPGRLAA
jgi:tRNA-dihydrouridine synthase B